MRAHTFPARGVVVLASLLVLACERAPAGATDPAAQAMPRLALSEWDLTETARAELAEARAATVAYIDRDGPPEAWVQATPCQSNPEKGGQGVHYLSLERLDPTPDHEAPELLMYEPQAGGQLRLVGVEYAVPFTQWTSAEPPELFGQHFHRNEVYGLWVLHAWIWRENPSGLFADWNPRVSCAA